MVVCHCKGINDRKLREVIRGGATCRGAVARACGAGTGNQCGGCRPVVDALLSEERTADAADLAAVADHAPLPIAG